MNDIPQMNDMPQMSSYSNGTPPVLSNALSVIQGASVNSFLVSPTSGSTSVPANGQIRIQVPSNAIIDWRTSKLHFSVETAGTATRLPVGIKTLVERCSILCGGTTIYQGNNFFNIQEYASSVAENRPLDASEHPEMCVFTDCQGGNATTGESYSAGLSANGGTVFSMDLGEFARTCSPRLWDLSLLPQIEIVFYLSPNSVLVAPKGQDLTGGTNPFTTANTTITDQTFTITNPVFVANCYSLADGMYSMALAQKIADVGYLELVYNQSLAFNQQWNSSARLSIGAMSLNKLTALFRLRTHGTRGGAVNIFGNPGNDTNELPKLSYKGTGYVNKSGLVEYQSKFQQLSCPVADGGTNGVYDDTTTPPLFQWSVNSSSLPQFQANVAQFYEMTKWANNVDKMPVKHFSEYLFNKFTISYPLNLPEVPHQKKYISGLDTRASNSYVELKGTNTNTTDYDCLILAETTSILRVGRGKSTEVLN